MHIGATVFPSLMTRPRGAGFATEKCVVKIRHEVHKFPACERARNAEIFVLVSVDPLQRLIGDIFRAEGCSAEESGRIASGLMSASLTGHESHGVLRTPR